jgi:hypothetical protein
VEAKDIYRIYFHGPAYQVLKSAWLENGGIVGEMASDLPAHHHPPTQPTILSPRALETCFQTAGIWEIAMQGHMGLPEYVERLEVFRVPTPESHSLYAVVTETADAKGFDADLLDAAGLRYLHLRGYRTASLPDAVEAEPLKALHAVSA